MRGNVRILCLKYNNFETLIHYLKTDIRVKKKKEHWITELHSIYKLYKNATPPPNPHIRKKPTHRHTVRLTCYLS